MRRLLLISLIVFLLPFSALAGGAVTYDITAQNQFTDAIRVEDKAIVVIEDTSSITASITLQVKPDGASSWVDTGDVWTAERAEVINYGAGQQFRVGVKTGDFTSGTCTVWILTYE